VLGLAFAGANHIQARRGMTDRSQVRDGEEPAANLHCAAAGPKQCREPVWEDAWIMEPIRRMARHHGKIPLLVRIHYWFPS
jgi:hypothetical protein